MTEKCFSTEEALNLLLETTDRDDSSEAGSSELDVDVVTLDPPGPKATKIDGYDGIDSDSTRRDFIQLQNVDAISLMTPSASSPSASPASTPPSSPVNISRKRSVKSRAKSTSKRADARKLHADDPSKRTKKKDGNKVNSDIKTVQRGKKKTAVTHSDNEPVVMSSVSSDNEPVVITLSAEHSSDSEPGVKFGHTNPSLTDSSSDNEPAVIQQRNVHINPSRYIPVTSDLGGCTDFSADNERSSDILSSSSSEVESNGSSSNTGKYLAPENFPGPPDMGRDVQKDIDELNDSLDDFDLGEAISETVSHPNFLISKIPFRIMCMYIKCYLMSIDVDPNRPQWPVPGMDKNQKRHF